MTLRTCYQDISTIFYTIYRIQGVGIEGDYDIV